MAFYIVVSPNKVYVDYQNGTVLGFETGEVFDADPGLPSVGVMLRANPAPITAYTPNEAFTAAPAGEPGGAATLDGSGNLTASQMPTFVARGFTGSSGPGPVTVTGAVVGQTVLAVWSVTGSPANAQADFESVITVDDELQQTAGDDHSLATFVVLLA